MYLSHLHFNLIAVKSLSDFWQALHLEVRRLLEGIYWRMAFILIGGRRLFETGSLLEGTRYHMTVYIWSFCDYGVMKLYDSKSRSTVIFNLKAFDINVAQPEIFFWFWYMLSFNKKRFSMTLNYCVNCHVTPTALENDLPTQIV